MNEVQAIEQNVDWWIAGSFLAVAVLLAIIYVRLHDRLKHQHGQVDRKLDVVRQDIGDVSDQVQGVSDQVEGVRINIDGHADAIADNTRKDRTEAKRFRLSIFQDFKDWLAVRGKDDNDTKPNGGSET